MTNLAYFFIVLYSCYLHCVHTQKFESSLLKIKHRLIQMTHQKIKALYIFIYYFLNKLYYYNK